MLIASLLQPQDNDDDHWITWIIKTLKWDISQTLSGGLRTDFILKKEENQSETGIGQENMSRCNCSLFTVDLVMSAMQFWFLSKMSLYEP